MKTKEFIRGVEELGYFINDYGDYYEITDVDENPIAEINKTVFLQLSTDHCQWEKLSEIDKKEFFDLLIEYTRTPIEDREEEKKFYLRHKFLTSSMGEIRREKSFINYNTWDNKIYLSDKRQIGYVQTIFTLEKIEKIKEKFDTNLADFELVEVEDEKM